MERMNEIGLEKTKTTTRNMTPNSCKKRKMVVYRMSRRNASVIFLLLTQFFTLHRAFTMSPEKLQYIWRKTIPHIEVGMGSGVFTSHRSARFVLISD